MKNKKQLNQDNVRVIKIGKEALFEFIYEKFIEEQECYFDVDPLDVMDNFEINFERGEFIFCVHKSEDSNGNIVSLPKEVNLQRVMQNMQDTTTTMFGDDRYREFTKDELIELSK